MLAKLFSVAALAVAFVLSAGSGTALANPDAEKFIGSLMDQGKTILHNDNEAARRSQLHQLVMQNVDAKKTALFALGAYQRGLPRQAIDQYVAAFSDYITTIYETRLEKYRDLDIKVLNSLDNGPNEATVLTQGKPANER